MQNTPDTVSDDDIIRKVIDGNTEAFSLLLSRYRDHVVVIVNGHVPPGDVAEIAHDVFVRAYRSLTTYKKKGGFKQWLSSIAVRTCHDFWRSRYRSREVPMSTLSENHHEWLENTMAAVSNQSFTALNIQKEAKELLEWGLGHLSADDRMVLELVYLEGYSVKEAAQLLGWSPANVKVRSFRSRKKLHKLLWRMIEEGKSS